MSTLAQCFDGIKVATEALRHHVWKADLRTQFEKKNTQDFSFLGTFRGLVMDISVAGPASGSGLSWCLLSAAPTSGRGSIGRAVLTAFAVLRLCGRWACHTIWQSRCLTSQSALKVFRALIDLTTHSMATLSRFTGWRQPRMAST